MQDFKEVLLEATMEAGEIIKNHFNRPFSIESKDGINNLVTEVDKLSEKKIVEIIQQHFPSHSIISAKSVSTLAIASP